VKFLTNPESAVFQSTHLEAKGEKRSFKVTWFVRYQNTMLVKTIMRE